MESAEDDIGRLLRFRPKGYQFAPSYKAERWDGYISLVRHRGGRTYFPAGLVANVLAQPWAARWEVRDLRKQPPYIEGLYAPGRLTSLDEAQEAAVRAATEAGRGVVQYPTGTGKARIIGETVRCLGVPTLVLCDKIDLVHQLAKELSACLGTPIGQIGGGAWAVEPCTVSTYQTLARRIKPDENNKIDREMLGLLNQFQAVICDEGHHSEAKTFANVLKHMNAAYYRLAFSATPFKSYTRGKAADKGTFLQVQAWTGPPIAQLSISDGVETGRIVPVELFVVGGCEWPLKRGPQLNFGDEYQTGIVENQARNALICTIVNALRRAGPTIIITERIEHGSFLADQLGSPFMHGGVNPGERGRHYAAFRAGDIACMVVSKIADEALDLPNVEHLVLAGGGRAPHRQIQRIGRGMRASAGKERVVVFDFIDYGKYIGAHYRRRRRLYDAEPAYQVVDIGAHEVREWLSTP